GAQSPGAEPAGRGAESSPALVRRRRAAAGVVARLARRARRLGGGMGRAGGGGPDVSALAQPAAERGGGRCRAQCPERLAAGLAGVNRQWRGGASGLVGKSTRPITRSLNMTQLTC